MQCATSSVMGGKIMPHGSVCYVWFLILLSRSIRFDAHNEYYEYNSYIGFLFISFMKDGINLFSIVKSLNVMS